MDANSEFGVSSNAQLLRQIAEAMALPHPPQGEWRAATVVMYSSDGDLIAAQVGHVQDLKLDIAEQALVKLAVSALRRHLGETSLD